MTREDLAPIGQDDHPGFPCPKCGGGGLITAQTQPRCFMSVVCPDCSGSGYGPPPPALDRLRAHCLERLSRWAQRNLPPPEETE